MYDNYNYPAGADNEQAPWNQEPVPEREFEVTVSQTLSRTVKIKTDDYVHVVTNERHNGIHEDYADTTDTDWKAAYQNADFKIQDLLLELKSYVQSDLAMSGTHTSKGKYLKSLLAACEGWIEDDYEVIEN